MVLFFVNGLGALALASKQEFVGQEMPPKLRMTLGLFGTVSIIWALATAYYAAGERLGL